MGDRKAGDATSLVVIGASAGGIEALERLVSALPETFATPVVIAQHADPKIPSHLPQILGRHTPLNIVTIDESDEDQDGGSGAEDDSRADAGDLPDLDQRDLNGRWAVFRT